MVFFWGGGREGRVPPIVFTSSYGELVRAWRFLSAAPFTDYRIPSAVSHFVTSSSSPCPAFFLPFLTHAFPEVLPAWLSGCWNQPEPVRTSTGRRRPRVTEAAPAAPHSQHLGACTPCKYNNNSNNSNLFFSSCQMKPLPHVLCS